MSVEEKRNFEEKMENLERLNNVFGPTIIYGN